MLKSSITPQDACDLLNELLKLDYDCVHALVANRVPCNKQLADHPTVQAQDYSDDPKFRVGLLGFLNGLFGVREDGMGTICMMVEGVKIVGFALTPTNDSNGME